MLAGCSLLEEQELWVPSTHHASISDTTHLQADFQLLGLLFMPVALYCRAEPSQGPRLSWFNVMRHYPFGYSREMTLNDSRSADPQSGYVQYWIRLTFTCIGLFGKDLSVPFPKGSCNGLGDFLKNTQSDKPRDGAGCLQKTCCPRDRVLIFHIRWKQASKLLVG